jgi:hypothetical protein
MEVLISDCSSVIAGVPQDVGGDSFVAEGGAAETG